MSVQNVDTSGPAIDDDATLSAEDRLFGFLGRYGRHVALLQAWVAMCGSLFMSEALGWIPCVLCWYQRILMYPLALILLVGILRRDRGVHLYGLPLSIGGALVALYHYLLTKTDWLPPPPCLDGVPCTVDYLGEGFFGFANVPFLALTAFLVISFMLGASALNPPEEEAPSARDGQALAAYALVALAVGFFVTWGQFV